MSNENTVITDTDNKEKTDEKVVCECGKEVMKRNLATHQKSKQHLKATNAEEEPLLVSDKLKLIDRKLDTILDVLDEMLEMASDEGEDDEVNTA